MVLELEAPPHVGACLLRPRRDAATRLEDRTEEDGRASEVSQARLTHQRGAS